MDIATRRLHSQRLAGEPLDGAAEVVGWLGAVQSQDYQAATWAVGQRTRGSGVSTVNRLFDDGAILRTHVLRPTWHLVLPGDIRWLLALTAPRIRAGMAGRLRALELDPATIARAETAFTTAL
ncbi:MAG: crosslink repair DNA glycosylase YcaQ family protein, partial [Candidatus Dormiibacterota bacterium]